MSNGASRVILSLVGLVVGFAVGWLAHRPAPVSEARDHLIRVHGNGSLSEPEAKISRKNGNKLAWTADGGATLEIAFPESGFPKNVKVPPFENMIPRPSPKNGTEWLVRCGDGTCFSGEIAKNLPDEDGLKFKYDQIVAGTRVDGWIIIDR